jgi:hypothetical protein
VNISAYLRSKLSLIQNVPILSSFLKLVAVFTLSALSFFITDFLPAVEWVLGLGINIGLSAAIFFFLRAGFAEWVAYTIMGVRGSKLRYRDLALPALIYGTPLFTFHEVFPLNPLSEVLSIIYSKWICMLPVPQSRIMSFIVAPLSVTLILDFPRLILFLAIKKKLSIYNMKKDTEAT